MFDTKTYRFALHRPSKKSPALNRETVELHLEATDVDQVWRLVLSRSSIYVHVRVVEICLTISSLYHPDSA